MTLQDRYIALHALLEPSGDLWAHSILERWAPMEAWIPPEWFEYGMRAPLEEQYQLGQGAPSKEPPESLKDWVARIKSTCNLPAAPPPVSIPPAHSRGMTPKKRHEVESILGFIQSALPHRPGVILDIGGGAGYLARHLAKACGCRVDSVDRNPVLQEEGQKQLARAPWKYEATGSVCFIPGEFPVDIRSTPAKFSIGLHTCGPLAWSHLEKVRDEMSVLNFGCCYEIMDARRDTQKSSFAQSTPLNFTRESLFLANRGGTERSLEEFKFQQRMQTFRFALHRLLEREGQGAVAGAVGNAHENHYRGTFAQYARNRCEHLSIDLGLSDTTLESSYLREAPTLERMRFAAFLRNLLSRPVELALLTDRALYAHEIAPAGSPEPQMLEFFDPKISPRNVGITLIH